jgi:hypothetical protein
MSDKKQNNPTKISQLPIIDLQNIPAIRTEEWLKMLNSSLKPMVDMHYQSQEAFRKMLGPYIESLKYINETIRKMTEFPRLKYIEQIETTNKLVSEALGPMFEEIRKNRQAIDSKNIIIAEPTVSIEETQPLSLQAPTSTSPVYAITQADIEQITKDISKEVIATLGLSKKNDKITIFLTSSGTLYRNIGDREIQYNAHDSKKPVSIFKFLSEQNNNFVKIDRITIQAGCTNDEATRKAISKFNDKANFRLRLGNNIIESKQGSGYRINPIYEIIDVE